VKRDDIDFDEIERHLIRELQGEHGKAHQALLNWAKWSRDRRGIFPSPNPPPSAIYDTFKRDEWDKEGYGEIVEVSEERLAQGDIKADKQEVEPYDETAGTVLDERIHTQIAEYLRHAAKAAYLSPPSVREDRFHLEFRRISGISASHSQFREYLGQLLAMVGRFA
jgi:hypothetical protein